MAPNEKSHKDCLYKVKSAALVGSVKVDRSAFAGSRVWELPGTPEVGEMYNAETCPQARPWPIRAPDHQHPSDSEPN